MKKYFFFLSIFAFSVNSYAQVKGEREPYLTRSLTMEAIKNVELKTSGGSISVTGVSSEARIEVYVYPNNSKDDLSKEEIKQRLEERYDLDISIENNKLTAIAKPKERITDWKKALNITFKVYVSQNVSTKLSTSGGSINLKNLFGNQDFSTSGGSLHMEELSGKIEGRTSGGSIHVENSKDEIDLSTSGGNIEARNCEGNIKLNTSGGSLNLNALKGIIKASTSGGGINGKNIQGELTAFTSGGGVQFNDLSCSLETSTSGGHINISFKELGKYVRISNSGGNIEVEVPGIKVLILNCRQ